MRLKKSLIFILLFLVTNLCKAQNSEHLSFKGVPIDGTINDYVKKMIQNGFKLIKTEDGTAFLNGDFAGYKDCFIGVSTLKQKDLVHKIAVVFSEKDTWSTLSTNYFDLKQMITEKYGNPFDVVEKFDSNSKSMDDDSKMYQVKFDNCKYYSNWQTDKGEIQLSIDHINVKSCFVKLAYFDKINSAIIKAQAKDDL